MGTYTCAARFYSESSNTFDPFAVSIMNDGKIVGHVLRQISAACTVKLCSEHSGGTVMFINIFGDVH